MTRRLAALAISLAVRGADLLLSQLRRFLDGRVPCTGVVLYYHAIKPHQRSQFARQMDVLLKRTSMFPAGSPEAMAKEGSNVAITFDDGFQSVVENAVPELAKRCIPFTVFVPSGSVGQRPSWVSDPKHSFWDERVLSAADLRALVAVPFATVGSHSITHRNLVDLDSADAEQELVGSRTHLQTALGASVDLFSFPHGAHTAALVDQARRAGYRRVFTIEPTTIEPEAQVFAVGRVAVDPDDWSLEFRLKIAGAYRWRHSYHRLRQAV